MTCGVLVAAAVLTTTQSLSAQDPSSIIDSADRFFSGIKTLKRTTPQATLQSWVQIQSQLHELRKVSSTTSDSAIAWEAEYVAAYGLWMTELFDIAAAIDSALVTRATTPDQRTRALRDLAQSLENAGRFGSSAEASARLIASMDAPRFLELNNHALRLLKAGHYEGALEYVKRIELTEESAHTRIFSARAHAYQGRYDAAMAELKAACDRAEEAACRMIESIAGAESPEAFWRSERSRRIAAWQPYNIIDSSISLSRADPLPLLQRRAVSAFAPSYWLNEIHGLYPAPGEVAIVPTLPVAFGKGRIGAAVIEGVPFVTIAFDEATTSSKARQALVSYLDSTHEQSEGEPKLAGVRTRALLAAASGARAAIAVVVHTDWQERLVRNALPGATIEVVPRR